MDFKLTLATATNPVYTSNTANSGIDLMVTFEEMPGQVLPFHATDNDVELHGVDIWKRAMNGEFGPIAPYVPPVISVTNRQPQPNTSGTQTV